MIVADDPDRKVEPDEIDDFGFHFPLSYLMQVCWVLESSGFQMWPNAGGLDDQNADLVADVMMWFKLVRRLRWEYEHEIWQDPEKTSAQQKYNPLMQR